MRRDKEATRPSHAETRKTQRFALTILLTAVNALMIDAFSISDGWASTSAGGLIPDAEIAATTFVDLDLGRFPKLPPNEIPATGAIFVSPQGNDAGSGSRQSPYRTIAHAVRAVSSPGTIVVREGIYREVWEADDYRALVLKKDHLTLMAYPGESVTMRPASGVTYGIVVNARNLVLRGIDLHGFSSIGVLFDSGAKRNRHVVIADLEITDTEEAIAMWEAAGAVDELLLANVQADAIIHCGTGPCSSWRLENVTIEAKGEGWGADAFAIEAGDNMLIVNVTVLGAGSDGIDTKATRVVVLNSRVRGVENNAIKLWHGGDVINTLIWRGRETPIVVEKGRFRLLNSTLGFTSELAAHRDYSMVFSYDERLPMQIEIVNSIISNPSGGAWINPESSQVSIRNSLFHSADGSEVLIHGSFETSYSDGAEGINQRYGSANLTADPRLDGNLRPAGTSPAIDAGIALTVDFPAHDVDGARRISGAVPDLGAYEAGGLTIAGCDVFPADNIWNVPVDKLPVDPRSATYVATIGATTGVHPDFGTVWEGAPIGIPYDVVPGTQPTKPVTFDYWDESDPGPYPIPDDPSIEGGPASDGDRHILMIDRDSCVLYELFYAYPVGGGAIWTAGSGAIFDLSSNALRPDTWTSADAAGLPIFPGLVRYEEVVAGEIRHALRFTVPETRKAHVWPARHDASDLTGGRYPPMGQRFRLKASFDVSPFPAEVQVILRALKKYGMILADNGSPWFVSGVPNPSWDDDALHTLHQVKGSDFEAVDVSSLMTDPDSAQTGATPNTACAADDETLCLNRGRFRVEVTWWDFKGETGSGHVVPVGSPDSGLFYFFDPNNWEMLVKVLDGCPINDHYWVFAAATTNVEYTLKVTDTETNEVRRYRNRLGVSSAAVTDSTAFDTCP